MVTLVTIREASAVKIGQSAVPPCSCTVQATERLGPGPSCLAGGEAEQPIGANFGPFRGVPKGLLAIGRRFIAGIIAPANNQLVPEGRLKKNIPDLRVRPSLRDL
jgi:hypothetical protein